MSMSPKVIVKTNILKLCEKLLKDVAKPPKISPVGDAIATPASQLQCPLAFFNIFGHCNGDAGVAIAMPEKI